MPHTPIPTERALTVPRSLRSGPAVLGQIPPERALARIPSKTAGRTVAKAAGKVGAKAVVKGVAGRLIPAVSVAFAVFEVAKLLGVTDALFGDDVEETERTRNALKFLRSDEIAQLGLEEGQEEIIGELVNNLSRQNRSIEASGLIGQARQQATLDEFLRDREGEIGRIAIRSAPSVQELQATLGGFNG